MTTSDAELRWTPRIGRRTGPRYRAIADALEADVAAGRLAPGDPLPTQRELAEWLGVNFTTVTRAYAEARRRGLVTARVGRGTFVAGGSGESAAEPDARAGGDVDLSVNAPPVPAWLAASLRDALARAGSDPAVVRDVLGYHARDGGAVVREAGATWLAWRGLAPAGERLTIAAGAQHALATLLPTLARPGETVLVEALAYPGVQSAAALAGVRLVGVELDEEGVRPDALARACRAHAAKALCCVPSLQNPTTAVMSLARRHAIVRVAREHGVRIIEDDICGALLADAPPPLAALAPELVTHVASLSKCVAPGLRTAFVLSPTEEEAARLAAAVRASVLMLSPLPLAVAASWISDGTAMRAVAGIRTEAAARGALARRIFGDRIAVPTGSLHAWLALPASWTVAAFVAEAQQRGIRITPADWYVMPAGERHATPPVPPRAVRVTLGAEPDRARLARALGSLAALLDRPTGLGTSTL